MNINNLLNRSVALLKAKRKKTPLRQILWGPSQQPNKLIKVAGVFFILPFILLGYEYLNIAVGAKISPAFPFVAQLSFIFCGLILLIDSFKDIPNIIKAPDEGYVFMALRDIEAEDFCIKELNLSPIKLTETQRVTKKIIEYRSSKYEAYKIFITFYSIIVAISAALYPASIYTQIELNELISKYGLLLLSPLIGTSIGALLNSARLKRLKQFYSLL